MTEDQSREQKRRFLLSFRETGNISESCRAVGIGSRHTIYGWKEHDEEFMVMFAEAEIQALEALEAEARRRAVVGDVTRRPVVVGKQVVGYTEEWKRSDTLLIFLLKANAPEKYRERVDLAHSGTVEHTLTIAQIRAAIGVGEE